MLRLIPTKLKKGAKLQGDYDDLHALRDALQRYLEFYQEATDYDHYDYEYLLALNYDIRHAYMGTRDFAAVDNHYEDYELVREGDETFVALANEDKQKLKKFKKTFTNRNLYFSVDIALPLVLYYLWIFQRILDAGCTDQWFDKYNQCKEDFIPDYTPYQAEKDRSEIALYNTTVWTYLENLLGREETETLFRYFTYNEEGMMFPAVYIDALLAYYMENVKNLSGDDLKEFIIYTAYCIFDPVSTKYQNKIFNPCHEQYKKAWNKIKNKVTKRMPSYMKFIQFENTYFGNKNEMNENEFNDFIRKYFGDPDWEGIAW